MKKVQKCRQKYRVSAYLDDHAYKRAVATAEKNGLGISSLVRMAVLKVLDLKDNSTDRKAVPTR